jgi:dTDP-4-dehydrorhamnose 3,5-epimerase
VAVDIRKGSPTFGRWFGVELNDENKRMLWVPPGFAHGFCVISDVAELVYKVTALYEPANDRAIRWNDPDIGIAWPIDTTAPQLSTKDAAAPLLANARVLPKYESSTE